MKPLGVLLNWKFLCSMFKDAESELSGRGPRNYAVTIVYMTVRELPIQIASCRYYLRLKLQSLCGQRAPKGNFCLLPSKAGSTLLLHSDSLPLLLSSILFCAFRDNGDMEVKVSLNLNFKLSFQTVQCSDVFSLL